MRVTDIEAHTVGIPPQTDEIEGEGLQDINRVIIKVHTDEGIVGLGECNWSKYRAKTMIQAFEELGDKFIIGMDPFNVERLRKRLYHDSHYLHVPSAVLAMVTAAVEIAFWDIIGKSVGEPIHNLLGGKRRNKVRSYTYMHYKWQPPEGSPEEAAEAAREYVEEGFTALKLDPVPPIGGPRTTCLEELEYTEQVVRAIREEVGTECDILIGTHGQQYTHDIIRLARRVEQYDPLWIEEPVPPERPEETAKVAEATTAPIATGERLLTIHQFSQLVQNGAAQIIQPNVGLTGLLEAKKAAAIAEANYVQVAPWMYATPIAGAASIHLSTTIPNFLIQEGIEMWDGFNAEIIKEPIEWEDGYLTPPDKPGLGIELDEDKFELLKDTYNDTPLPEQSLTAFGGEE